MIYAEKEKTESPFVSVNTITRGRVLSPTELAYGISTTPPYQAKEQTEQSRAPAAEIQEDGVSSQSSGQTIQLKAKDKADESSDSNWLLEQVSGLVRNIPGYDLLALAIGRDPLTGKTVQGNGMAWGKAVMGLIPGGAVIFDNLEKAGVIERAVTWLKAEIELLEITFAVIKDLFDQAWAVIVGTKSPEEKTPSPAKTSWYKSFVEGAKDLTSKAVNVGKAIFNAEESFNQIKQIFLPPINRIIRFISNAGSKLMKFVFEGGLTLANAPVQKVMAIVNKGKGVLQQIISDPIGFLKNLLQAIHGGLRNFLDKIGTYLQSGLAGWLFGTLSSAGIVLPEKLDLHGIFSLSAQILDVTWQAIKTKVVNFVGPKAEKVMAQVEKTVTVVTDLITKGPIALFEKVKDFLGDLKTRFFDSVIEWVRNSVIVKGIQKLISMFNPVGAIVQAAITIGSTIKFFIDKAKQIATFANAVFDSVTEIAAGNLKKAVMAVEESLAKALPVAIGFMANLAGIGGIVEKIKDVIKKIRAPIDKAVEEVVGFVADKAKALIAKFTGAGQQREEPPQNAEEQDDQVMLEKDITTRLSTHENAYLVKLGLYANTEHGSVEAKSGKTTEEDRKIMLTLGKKYGCHHTGNKNLNYYVPDHQAPTSLFKLAETDTYVFNLLKTHGVSVHKKQRLYPQSKLESDKQGGVVSTLTQKLRKLIELKKNKNKG